jgi:hypothetical protein
VSFALKDGDTIEGSIPLTSWETVRKEQLEKVVEGGLQEFLRVGAALAELRNRRLYRTTFATFEQYVRSRFGLSRSSADHLIRTTATALALLEGGEKLLPSTTEAVIRPISALPTPELKAACWSLAKAVAPTRGPTQPLVSKLCRMVRNCLEEGGDEAGPLDVKHSGRHRSVAPPERETPFVRPVLRLSSWAGFSAEVIVSHLGADTKARGVYTACGILAERCRQVQARLLAHFPELEVPTDGLNHQS